MSGPIERSPSLLAADLSGLSGFELDQLLDRYLAGARAVARELVARSRRPRLVLVVDERGGGPGGGRRPEWNR